MKRAWVHIYMYKDNKKEISGGQENTTNYELLNNKVWSVKCE